ncbi:pseudouridine synthase [Aquabacterium sp.]|uniref:pseudouridine synthase n=1 Tax=Aquabacterium sp. TaxID=1872578 RepID=UPI002E320632|nr:pseudouridine synthase [Aquabacterium sp.]HEX5313229.1 pseudouridine synthase [Aquabacterium sp.]
MTERKKLTLNKPAAGAPTAEGDRGPRRAPVRGSGTAPRQRPTAEQAAKAREERAQRAERGDFAPPSERGDRFDRSPRDGHATRADRGPRAGYADRGERGPRHESAERGQRSERRAPSTRSGPASYGTHEPRDRQDTRPTRPAHATRDEGEAYPRTAAPALPKVSSHDDGRMRLSKLMSERGLASRREADEWIEQGWVRVNGEVVEELGTRVFPDVSITIDPLARTQQAQRVTILINKPIGYVSGQAEDGYEPAVALIRPENRWSADRVSTQLTRGHLRNLAPAGRLDIDSTGLLVLTQDGRIAKALIGEDSGIEKEYLVRVQYMAQPDATDVSRVVPPEAIDQLRFGLELDGRQLKPAKVSWQNEHQLRFVLREGRKRQIRRMCELVGLKVVGLKRVRMGRIALGDLPMGQWRFLRPDEQF